MSEAVVHRGIAIARRGQLWRWRARSQGIVVQRSYSSLELATKTLDEFLDGRERARASEGQRVAISELCSAWLKAKRRRLAPGTAAQYELHIRCHIGPGIGDQNAEVITPRELEAFYAHLRWKAAKESHNVLRQAFAWAVLNGEVRRSSNPALLVRPDRRACIDHDGTFSPADMPSRVLEKHIPTRAEVEKLLLDAEEHHDSTWWLYLKVAATIGARPGEVCALRREHLDEARGTVAIEWSADKVSGQIKRPKSAWSIRTLAMPEQFFAVILPYLPVDPAAFLFPSNTRKGQRSPLPCWNARSVKRRLDKALQRGALPHYTPHSLRHYVATHLLDGGWPPLQVARFLGHADDSLVRKLYGNHIVDDTQRSMGEFAATLV